MAIIWYNTFKFLSALAPAITTNGSRLFWIAVERLSRLFRHFQKVPRCQKFWHLVWNSYRVFWLRILANYFKLSPPNRVRSYPAKAISMDSSRPRSPPFHSHLLHLNREERLDWLLLVAPALWHGKWETGINEELNLRKTMSFYIHLVYISHRLAQRWVAPAQLWSILCELVLSFGRFSSQDGKPPIRSL